MYEDRTQIYDPEFQYLIGLHDTPIPLPHYSHVQTTAAINTTK